MKVVEVPPGPPVLAPIVAEVYGPRYGEQQRLAKQLRAAFDRTPDIVDTDDSVEAPAPRLVAAVDRQKAALLGVAQDRRVQTLRLGLAGADVTYMHVGRERYPIPVRLELPAARQGDDRRRARARSRARRAGRAFRSRNSSA